jgi:hypothetical protein
MREDGGMQPRQAPELASIAKGQPSRMKCRKSLHTERHSAAEFAIIAIGIGVAVRMAHSRAGGAPLSREATGLHCAFGILQQRSHGACIQFRIPNQCTPVPSWKPFEAPESRECSSAPSRWNTNFTDERAPAPAMGQRRPRRNGTGRGRRQGRDSNHHVRAIVKMRPASTKCYLSVYA